MMVLSALFALSCDRPAYGAGELPKPEADLPKPKEGEKERAAVFAGGCFWCVEGVFERVAGVKDVVSGYAGDTKEKATYEQVCSGKTNHAEAVRILYDPAKISYGELLRIFFTTHDPTTRDRQGPDHGRQYRSAIFFENEEQKKVAQAYIAQLEKAKVFPDPIVTTVEPLSGFFAAEGYHQDFVRNNPEHPYIRRWAVPKIDKLLEKFKDETRQAPEKK